MMLWSGRFSKELDQEVNDFNSSISFDSRMAIEDIRGSMAHAGMLGATGIIDPADADLIIAELERIEGDIISGNLSYSERDEDIHMFIERVLTDRIGDAGKRLHTARSRNDQVALDLRMYLKKEIKVISTALLELLGTLISTSSEHLNSVMPGYTHLQRAQPTTFAHYLMAYAEMFRRDIERLHDAYSRVNTMPLGSGAMGSTTYPINRNMVADSLGFVQITRNSIDGVSDRDFVIELSSALALVMMHLSRFSEEIILWCSHEFGFVSLDDAYSTGSSIMPQKRNPDVAELVRGKTGRVYGNLMGILTVMKGLPLAYNKDIQEDKEGIFDSIDTVKQCLLVFTPMFASLTINVDKMRETAAKGFTNATDCADYLTKKGVPFRDAYTATGKLVKYCIDNNKTLESLTIDEYKAVSPSFETDIYRSIDLETCISQRNVTGGPAPDAVKTHIGQTASFIASAESLF